MIHQTRPFADSLERGLHQENIEVAIQLYEGANTLQEEERWLNLLEKALQSTLIFSAEDLDATTRARRKEQHTEAFKTITERIQQRKEGEISKYELASDIRQIYIDAQGRPPLFRQML